MRTVFLVLFLTFALCVSISAQDTQKKYDLPELHKVKAVTLSPTYSCRSPEDPQTGYAATALFVTEYSRQRNSPDLVFNGACNSESFFQSSVAGDDMSLISDLGQGVSFEEVSASKAFNLARVHSFDKYSQFANAVKVIANHTYAVLLNTSEKRGLIIFKVVNFQPNRVDLQYVVKMYQLTPGQTFRSEGFDWSRPSN